MVAEHTTDLVCTDDPAWISATGCELDGTSPLRTLQRTLPAVSRLKRAAVIRAFL